MYMVAGMSAESLLECTHEHTQAVRRVIAGGREMVWEQCITCGKGIGSLKKTNYYVDALPEWDEEAVTRRAETIRLYYEQRSADSRAEWDARIQGEREEFGEKYATYLKSPEWARLKRRALVRDHFRCQHCFAEVNETSSQAHHILPYGYDTFRRYGYSLTFEVVTLCLRCHALAHKDKQS